MNNIYPWQTKQWQLLIARWREQKPPHALFFAGPKGLGKLDFAKSLAARLLCRTPITTAQACGECHSCQWFRADAHPDFFQVQPEADSQTIKVEQIRELLESLQQTAQSAQQVVIIEPAEAMNKAAANALLKTLEEPSGQVVFLLVSHQPGSVAATIRSRCQKIDFIAPPQAESLAWLAQQLPTQQNLSLLLSLAENIPLRALKFADPARLAAHHQLADQFIQLSQNQLSPLQLAATCADQEWQLLFEDLSLLLLDIMRLQQSREGAIANTHISQSLVAIATRLSPTRLFHFCDELLKAKKILDQKIHLNMTLVWENLWLVWAGSLKN